MSLFCDTTLASRIERADAQLMAKACSGFVLELAGGVATFDGVGSPFTKVAGLGFGGVPTDAELASVEAAYRAVAAPVQVELSVLADPEIGALLTECGYRLESFENVSGRPLTPGAGPTDSAGTEVGRSGDDEFAAWLDVVVEGVAVPDVGGLPGREDFPRAILEDAMRAFADAGVVRYLARRDGAVAGGASMHLAATGIAQLTGAATAPAHRRRGVQSALLAARLADAADAGCDLAVVTTQPGSKSQQNVQRQGFDLLYTRAVLVKVPS